MVKNKQVGDIVWYLRYSDKKVFESQITKVRPEEESYDLVKATGEEIKHVRDWHLYETKEEAEHQALPISKENLNK